MRTGDGWSWWFVDALNALAPGSAPQTPADEQLGRSSLLYSNSIFQLERVRSGSVASTRSATLAVPQL